MNKDDLKKILNTVYEMEGLIDMAIRRGEEVPDGVIQLIAKKSEILVEITSAWNCGLTEDLSLMCEDYSVDDEQVLSDVAENNPGKEIGHNDSDPDENIEVDFIYDEDPEQDIATDEPTEMQVKTDASLFDASVFEDDVEADVDNAEFDDDDANQECVATGTYDFIDDDNDDVESQEENFSYEQIRLAEGYNVHERKDIRKYFTINDRYRFRRELFSNNEVDFVDNLNLVQAMSCYEDAEDYFYNDLQWDSESKDVVEFMSIIFRYFN